MQEMVKLFMKTKCSNLKCKYINKNNECICKNLILQYWSVSTKNMGRKDFLECKSFEYSNEYLKLENEIKKIYKEM